MNSLIKEKTLKRKPCYFKKGDIIIYLFLFVFFFCAVKYVVGIEAVKGNKIEIYVDNQLKYVYPLQEKRQDYFIDTNLGGVNVQVEKMKVRVTSSNSPLKICVKQGWISNAGDAIIGIPDRLLIKIVGEKKDGTEELDSIAR